MTIQYSDFKEQKLAEIEKEKNKSLKYMGAAAHPISLTEVIGSVIFRKKNNFNDLKETYEMLQMLPLNEQGMPIASSKAELEFLLKNKISDLVTTGDAEKLMQEILGSKELIPYVKGNQIDGLAFAGNLRLDHEVIKVWVELIEKVGLMIITFVTGFLKIRGEYNKEKQETTWHTD